MSMDATDLPPIPVMSVSKIFALRDKIVENCDILGDTLTLEMIQDWSWQLARSLGASQGVVFQSCRNLLNKLLTYEGLRQVAWRLAANQIRLQAGETVPYWQKQPKAEWVVLQFMEGATKTHGFNERKQFGWDWQLVILTGLPAGQRQTYWLSTKQCASIGRIAGFTKSYGHRPWQHVTQLSGLRVACWITPPERQEQNLKLQTFDCTGSLRKHNLDLLNFRFRLSAECPNRWTHPCHQCHLGYDQCHAATHAKTYIQRNCVLCETPNAWFNPDKLDKCLACRAKEK